VKKFIQAFVFEPFQLAIKVLSTKFDLIEPFFSIAFGELYIVNSAIVVTLNSVFEVSGEAGFRVLVFPQIAQLL